MFSSLSGWSNFGPWSDCTVTCGGGFKHRSQECHLPGQGKVDPVLCNGSSNQSIKCGQKPCSIPIHGNWTQWQQWGQCNQTNGGVRERKRFCNNPSPQFGGDDCEGDAQEMEYCPGKYYNYTSPLMAFQFFIGKTIEISRSFYKISNT